jgi:hypothetical protein
MEKADKDTTLIVMSDHGFAGFNRCFNLNSWLLDNGYTYLLDPENNIHLTAGALTSIRTIGPDRFGQLGAGPPVTRLHIGVGCGRAFPICDFRNSPQLENNLAPHTAR